MREGRRRARADAKAERARVREEARARKREAKQESQRRREQEQAERAAREAEQREADRLAREEQQEREAAAAAAAEAERVEAEERARVEREEAEEKVRRREQERAAAVAALAAAGPVTASSRVAPPRGDDADESPTVDEPPVEESSTDVAEERADEPDDDRTQEMSEPLLIFSTDAEEDVDDAPGAAEASPRDREEPAADAETSSEPDLPAPPELPRSRGSKVADVAAMTATGLAVVAFVCSILLAVSALLLGAGVSDSGVAASVYSVADTLSAPVSGIVTLSGEDADLQNAFAAYGIGSLVYLVVAFAVPSVVRTLSRR